VFGPLKQHWRDADFTIMGKWKWLFVNGCERKSVLSTVGDYVEEYYYYFSGLNKQQLML